MSAGVATIGSPAPAPSAVDSARAFAVMLGGSVVLDVGVAASMISVANVCPIPGVLVSRRNSGRKPTH